VHKVDRIGGGELVVCTIRCMLDKRSNLAINRTIQPNLEGPSILCLSSLSSFLLFLFLVACSLRTIMNNLCLYVVATPVERERAITGKT